MEDEFFFRTLEAATLREESWQSVLPSVARHVGAGAASMSSLLEQNSPRSFFCSWHLPSDVERLCSEYLQSDRSGLQEARSRGLLAAGTVVDMSELLSVAGGQPELESWPIGVPGHGIGIVLSDERDAVDGPRAVLAVWRSRHQAEFSVDDRRAAAAMAPLLRASLLAHWRCRRHGLGAGWREKQIEQLGLAFFLLSESGSVLFISQAGADLLRDSRTLELRNDELWCAGEPLCAALDPKGGESQEIRSTASEGYVLRLLAMQASPPEHRLFRWLPRIGLAVLAAGVTAELLPPDAPLARFAQRHALTQSERTIMAELLRGHSMREIAHKLNLSHHNVRAQIRNVLAKSEKRNSPPP